MSRPMLCDLHTHSVHSDGTWEPASIVRAAEELGLAAVALCDHNTVSGLPEFMAAGEGSPVETVAGVEFSTDYGEVELHILALFIRPECYEDITALADGMLARKEQSNAEMVEKLRELGYDISYQAIRDATPGGLVNRALIGAALVEKGYFDSIQQAFESVLAKSRGLYRAPERLDVFETIRFIRSIGAVCVLAHPLLDLRTEAELRAFLERAVPCGLDGMEVYYPKYSPEETCLAKRLAVEFGLLPSGGSDFHGDNKPDIALGRGRGTLAVPISVLEDLRTRIRV